MGKIYWGWDGMGAKYFTVSSSRWNIAQRLLTPDAAKRRSIDRIVNYCSYCDRANADVNMVVHALV